MKQKIRKLKEEFDNVFTKLIEIDAAMTTNKEEVIYVPEEIGLTAGEGRYSVGVLNNKDQGLFYYNHYKNWGVVMGPDNDNNGKNFKLVKASKLEVGKVYFVADKNDELHLINYLDKYRLYLQGANNLRWFNDKLEYMDCLWSNHYEVVYCGDEE